MIKAKKISFIFPENITSCVHDVIKMWLCELDIEQDEKIKMVLKQKVMELEQVINRTGKPNIHFHDGNYNYEKVKFVNDVDDESLQFLNDLRKFNKEELVDLIHEFWTQLKKEAESGMSDNVGYMMEEFSRIKMTEVNRLKILTKFKYENK